MVHGTTYSMDLYPVNLECFNKNFKQQMYINLKKKKNLSKGKFNGFYILTIVPCDCLCKPAIREALGFHSPQTRCQSLPHHEGLCVRMNFFSRKEGYTGCCYQSTEGTHQAEAVVCLGCHTTEQRNCLAIRR